MQPHLDHEVLYASVEHGAVVVVHARQAQEVLARAWHNVAVQLNVEVAQAGVDAHIALQVYIVH